MKDFWPALQTIGLSEGASQDNLKFTDSITQAVSGAEFVQENGPERLEVKQGMLAEIESGPALKPSSHLIPLVEVLGGKKTSPEVMDQALAFYTSIGKKPIRINKEVAGHVANRLQVALWTEMFHLVQSGVTSVEDIDTAISYGPGLRWALLGPFLNLHASGGDGGITHVLEHIGPSQREWARTLGSYPETDDYISVMADGVAAELESYNWSETLDVRDQLLIDLIVAKNEKPQLP